jgi:elongation factor G
MPTSRDKIFQDLTQEFRDGLICPVLLGSARENHGIFRLLKALRHEAPTVDVTARRLKLENAKSAAYVMKSLHTAHGGKLSLVRILTGEFGEGTVVTGAEGRDERAAGVFSLRGEEPVKRGTGKAGDTVALGRLEQIKSGETISAEKGGAVQAKTPPAPPPVFAIGLGLKDRKDEVKLTAALAKLIEDDPSLRVEMNADTHQMLLYGQGEMHLRVASERLQRKYGIAVQRQARLVPYKETIRGGTQVRGRHKKQSGGHGQFGDVVLDIQPRARGAGFEFVEKISGGVVPRQFFQSVEIGVKDYLQHGPLGFPVVDVAVTLLDGSYHTVDSSDMAFRQAARIGMTDGLPKCAPVLLEPVMAVEIAVPSEATARINAIIAQRRGQILGFDAREGWSGWDVVQAQMPASEMENLIVDLRSATSGVGTYTSRFDHLAELTGRLADQVLSAHRQAAE